jgi:hypothetical protein
LRTRLERAIEIADFVGLIEQAFPDAAMRLAEYALRLLQDAGGLIDDSDGELGRC